MCLTCIVHYSYKGHVPGLRVEVLYLCVALPALYMLLACVTLKEITKDSFIFSRQGEGIGTSMGKGSHYSMSQGRTTMGMTGTLSGRTKLEHPSFDIHKLNHAEHWVDQVLRSRKH